MNYKLRCNYFNDQHVGFTLFDRTGASCGQISVLRSDVYQFLGRNGWQGDVDWQGKNLDIGKFYPDTSRIEEARTNG